MAQIPILSGIYTDTAGDIRTAYPRNMVPVPKINGVSQGYLRPGDGLAATGEGPGIGRGGINWNNQCYRVMGTKLVLIASDSTVSVLGDVGSGGKVTFDYSFDRLGVSSGGRLFYWDGATLNEVVDPDLGTVVDFVWIDGYFLTTDGTSLVVTELNDPLSVNPLKYGSSEIDPDPVLAVLELRNEVHALNRYTIEVFQNIGGDFFPFQRIDGAQVPRGAIGTFACAVYLESIAFLGSGRNEAPAVWLASNGASQKISTREVDQVIATYTEAELTDTLMEVRVFNGHQHLYVHMPTQTLVYDAAASQVLGEAVWFTLTSSVVDVGQYRARDFVFCYDQWLVSDPQTAVFGRVDESVSTHYEEAIGWEFNTQILYNESMGAIVNSLELVGITGRVPLGANPYIWTSYSTNGEEWSQERAISAGTQGQRDKRLSWRKQGHMRNMRIQKFRGTSDAHLSFARLEAQLEPLSV